MNHEFLIIVLYINLHEDSKFYELIKILYGIMKLDIKVDVRFEIKSIETGDSDETLYSTMISLNIREVITTLIIILIENQNDTAI